MLMKTLRKLLSEQTYGRLRYRRYPTSGRNRGPLNGQRGRCLLMAEIIDRLSPTAIVETGTFLGNSTEWLSAFQLPIYTIEQHPEFFGFARERVRMIGNVTTVLADSRSGLSQLLSGALSERREETILVYLDAHWNDDLPLGEELDLVFGALPGAVVVIDDFQVPDDPGYSFDDYGPGKSLTPDYIEPAVKRFDLGVYYPSLPSSQETGAKRGCVVLIKGERHQAAMAGVSRLRGGGPT